MKRQKKNFKLWVVVAILLSIAFLPKAAWADWKDELRSIAGGIKSQEIGSKIGKAIGLGKDIGKLMLDTQIWSQKVTGDGLKYYTQLAKGNVLKPFADFGRGLIIRSINNTNERNKYFMSETRTAPSRSYADYLSGMGKGIGSIINAGRNLASYFSGNKTDNTKWRVGSFGAGVGSRHEIYKTITPLNITNNSRNNSRNISDLVSELFGTGINAGKSLNKK